MYETVIVRDSKTGPVTTVRRSRDAPQLDAFGDGLLVVRAPNEWCEVVAVGRLLRCSTTPVDQQGGC